MGDETDTLKQQKSGVSGVFLNYALHMNELLYSFYPLCNHVQRLS